MSTAIPFLGPVDLGLNEVQNARWQQLASDPGSPVEGQFWENITTHELKWFNGTDVITVGSSDAAGTVTSVAVESANGFSGTVADDTTDAAITLKTTVNGVMKGNSGTGVVSAATAGTDYLEPDGDGSGLTGLTVSQVTGAAPLASPALTGTPTAPTATALTNTTQVATTAYADAATGVEKTRALAAEALLAPLASPALTGAPTTPTPSTTTGIANKGYVDSVAQGLDAKPSVAAVATANITLSGTQTIDGVALTAGQRVLATAQTTASQNGLWVVASGSWTRPADFASGSTQLGAYALAEAGTAGAGYGWVLTGNTAVTVDTTSQAWTKFNAAGSVSAGAGISVSGSQVSIENSGVLTVAHGGTGAATAAGAKSSLGFAGVYNSGTLGDGSATTITVTHNLGNAYPAVTVWLLGGTNPVIADCRVESTGTNSVQLIFGSAPASNTIRCTVTG